VVYRSLKFYGPSTWRDQLEPLLVWATHRQRGFPPRNGHSSASHIVPGASVPHPRTVSVSSSVAGPSSQRRSTGMTPSQTKAHEEAIRKQQESLSKAAELKSMLNNLEKVDDEGRRGSLLDTLCSTDDILNLPLHPNPPGTKNGQLVVDLLKHQVRRHRRCNVLCHYCSDLGAESSLAMVH
jgi:SWI/SNF-related matrix-associated actin-dependent regulator of chromatin subfamily A3